jgi:tripartite-type tricarboxylate transporter receptor subunit TctC
MNSITRRRFSAAAASAASTFALPGLTRAQNYPARPVRLIVPFAAGGVGDVTARIAADKLGEKLGQRFVIENQPGPGGILAGRAIAAAAPDGYTLGLLTNGTAISEAIYRSLPFRPTRDFATISSLGFSISCSRPMRVRSSGRSPMCSPGRAKRRESSTSARPWSGARSSLAPNS